MSKRVQTAKGVLFDRALKQAQKARAASFKESTSFKAFFDLPVMNLVKRVQGIKKEFKRIAFVGPNPYLFLQHLPKGYEVERFYFCESA